MDDVIPVALHVLPFIKNEAEVVPVNAVKQASSRQLHAHSKLSRNSK